MSFNSLQVNAFLHNEIFLKANNSQMKKIPFQERVSHPKRLHGGVMFLESIPKSPSGKILRRILREMAKNHKSKL